MSSHRARKPTGSGHGFVVLRGGLDLDLASGDDASVSARSVSAREELEWNEFAERIGFDEAAPLPDDYEDRLAERIFGASAQNTAVASFHTGASVEALDFDSWEPASGIRAAVRPRASRSRVVAGVLLAAAAVLIAWTSAGSSSPVASPSAPRDASSPAVHAIDATSTPESAPAVVEECRSVEPAPEQVVEAKPEPNPGVQLAKRFDHRAKKKGGHATSDVARAPRSSLAGSASRGSESAVAFVEEVAALSASLAQPSDAEASPALVSSSGGLDSPRFASRIPTQLENWAERPSKSERSWGLVPTGERWLGVSASPSEPNTPRAIAVTAQLDVTRAFASF